MNKHEVLGNFLTLMDQLCLKTQKKTADKHKNNKTLKIVKIENISLQLFKDLK